MSNGAPDTEGGLTGQVRDLLRSAAVASSYDLLGGQDLDEYLRKLTENAEIVAWMNKGRVRGFIAFYCNDPTRAMSYVSRVVVDPSCRGQSVGETLVRLALVAARARSFRSCRLRVHRGNSPAITLYERCGFAAAGEEGDYRTMEIAL